MTINFYLNRRCDRRHNMQIFLYIRFDKKLLKIYTGEKTKSEHWDIKAGRPVKNSPGVEQLTDFLDSWEAEIKAVSRDARAQRKDITVEYLKSKLSFIRQQDHTFFGRWDKYIAEESINQGWAIGTKKRYQTCKKHLAKINETYKLEFGSINNDFLQQFIKYHTTQGFANSFTEKNLVVLKTFLNWATRNNYSTNIEYKKWRVKFKKPSQDENIVFLTIDELISLYKLKLNNDTLCHVRDCFCFSCFTGLRHSDLQNLKKANIHNENIKITTIKTNKTLNVSINKYAKVILDRYIDHPGPYALPVISNQKTNDHLKDIGQRAKLNDPVTELQYSGNERQETVYPKWTKLTTHVARKTFVTTAVYLDIPLEVVIEITGQTLEVVRRYYKIQDKQKEREMKKFDKLRIA